jgi:hypothetical protein
MASSPIVGNRSSDARLWALLAEEIRRAGVPYPEPTQRVARQLVAVVRRERAEHQTWAPGEQIPADVLRVADVAGDAWWRDPGGQRAAPGVDPDEVEAAGAETYDDEHLLDRLGCRGRCRWTHAWLRRSPPTTSCSAVTALRARRPATERPGRAATFPAGTSPRQHAGQRLTRGKFSAGRWYRAR